MSERIVIFDTTLRDGEQSPGASMDTRAKMEVARQLEKLAVDVIEAGFPVSSPGDFEAVKAVAGTVKEPTVAGLARCVRGDIDAAAGALEDAKKPRIHVFLATSKIHMKYKLKKAEEEILKLAVDSVKYAKKFVDDVEFSPEDASRTDLDFLAAVFDAVVDAGATTVNIPDTVGYATPEEFGRIIKHLREKTKNGSKAIISVHCHNDLGLAVANSLAAVVNGAQQVECTVNGIGERAGNCSLEEVVMAIRTRKDILDFRTGINTREIIKASRLVSKMTGIIVQPNKAIVGRNAFAHEAGIHQDGILKERTTYEIMKPADVGLTGSKLVLGKHSGRHAFSERLRKLGYTPGREEVDEAFAAFKSLADKKKEIYDEDIRALMEEQLLPIPSTYQLEYIQISTGTTTIPTATVRLKKEDEVFQDASCGGDGPVDAAYKTIDRITKMKCRLLQYSLRAVTSGKDAMGEVTVRVRHRGTEVTGRGTSTDVIEASAKAYINAINRLLFVKGKAGSAT
ncbi:2-isopropylmalate synthase [bacterium]|nr:2-isopropylmalate synthase [bacterium]